MDQFVTLAIQASGAASTRELHGREFRVVPSVLVREQVLRNNLGATFLPADGITPDFAEAANGAPVLTDHPTRGGIPTSGRSPEIMNELGVGFLFNVKAEENRLVGEVWIDPSRAEAVGDLTAILERLERGETVELSTGFPARLERVAGAFNGEEYDVVIRPIGFDHLAVFAEKTGACSVKDGCGLGANEGAEPPPIRARGVLQRVYAVLGLDTDTKPKADEPPGDNASKEGQSMNREQMIAALAAVVALSSEELGKLTDCELKALHNSHQGGSGEPLTTNERDELESLRKRNLALRAKNEELEQKIAPTIENQKERRIVMLEDLEHTSRPVAWNRQELRAMSFSDLERVHRQVFGAGDFTGRGGPLVGNEGGFSADFVEPIFGVKEA